MGTASGDVNVNYNMLYCELNLTDLFRGALEVEVCIGHVIDKLSLCVCVCV